MESLSLLRARLIVLGKPVSMYPLGASLLGFLSQSRPFVGEVCHECHKWL